MAYDALKTVQALVTATAGLTSAVLDMETTPGTPRGGMAVRVRSIADSCATAGSSYYFQLDESPDQTSWTNLYQSPAISPETTTTYRSPVDLPLSMTMRYARLQLAFAGTAGSPQVTFAADLGQEWPG